MCSNKCSEILTVLDIAYHAILTVLDIVYHAILTVLDIVYHAILTVLDIVYHATLTVLNIVYHAILTVLDIEINECLLRLYDNLSPRPLEDSNFDVSDAITESFSSSPIPIEDSDSLMEEIDLFLTPDDSMPPGIETDDYDSEGDIIFFE
ncbi:hypothetical protein Tco_1078785 [Tanacetum coccineum]|uniref:Uncharacterized protein n=1 Tax=Tanacetum coccineum TaxID=301880 RepID=A0ABQ5HRM5_9ASTR